MIVTTFDKASVSLATRRQIKRSRFTKRLPGKPLWPQDGHVPKLALYHFPSCYFCKLVRRTLDRHEIEVELRNIHQDRKWHDELVAARGRRTVPVLRIETDDGQVQWMGESFYISRYLEKLAAEG